MPKSIRFYSIGIMMIVSVFILFNCTKEVDYEDLEMIAGLWYEDNSEEPYSGKTIGLYENGQQKLIFEYKDGKLHGTLKEWHENGQQRAISEVKDGEFHGTYKSWHENGQQRFIFECKDGKPHGTYIEWYENGEKEYMIEFSDGKYGGEYISWYENGKKCIQIDEITGGELHNGPKAPMMIVVFNSYNNGKSPDNLRFIKNKVIDGTYKNWYENGELHWKAEFDDGIIDGDIKEWSESGKRLN